MRQDVESASVQYARSKQNDYKNLADTVLKMKSEPAPSLARDYTVGRVRELVSQALSEASTRFVPSDELMTLLPPAHVDGDIAFRLKSDASRLDGLSGERFAEVIGDTQLGDFVEEVRVQGVNINIKLSTAALSSVLDDAVKLGPAYGHFGGSDRTPRLVDYAGPNPQDSYKSELNTTDTVKLCIIRSLVVGEALSRLYDRTGYRTVRVNNIGDWCAPLSFPGRDDSIVSGEFSGLLNLLQNGKAINYSEPDLFRAMEQRTEGFIYHLNEVFDLLGVRFDINLLESSYASEYGKTINMLTSQGIAEEKEGAKLIDMKGKAYGMMRLQRPDGTITYSARDLTILDYRSESLSIDDCVYVAGEGQRVHFEQLLAAGKRLGIPAASKSKYCEVGHVALDAVEGLTLEAYIDGLLEEALTLSPDLGISAGVIVKSFVNFEHLRVNPETGVALGRMNIHEAMRRGLGDLLAAYTICKDFLHRHFDDERLVQTDDFSNTEVKNDILGLGYLPFLYDNCSRRPTTAPMVNYAQVLARRILHRPTSNVFGKIELAAIRSFVNLADDLGIGGL